MNRTPIEWTTFSSNPLKFRDADGRVVWGCVHASPGCQHCYAESIAHRWGKGGPFNVPTMSRLTPFIDEKELHHMLTAKTIDGQAVAGSKVFVGDMTDLFGDWVPDDLLDRLFAVFALRSDVTWQVLTKRPERMRDYFADPDRTTKIEEHLWAMHTDDTTNAMPISGVLRHVWLGFSAEDELRFNARWRQVAALAAAGWITFCSAEPLLGSIDMTNVESANHKGMFFNALEEDGGALSWVIVGGESGPKARPMEMAWMRSILRQCQSAGVPCFVKQLGTKVFMPHIGINVDPGNGKRNDPAFWPEDIRVREFPAAVSA